MEARQKGRTGPKNKDNKVYEDAKKSKTKEDSIHEPKSARPGKKKAYEDRIKNETNPENCKTEKAKKAEGIIKLIGKILGFIDEFLT